jgi:DNA-binding LacI/PurR family transcriptional regulator
VDNASGAALATRYLLGIGHETVHHIAGPTAWVDAQERVAGWREALAQAGAPVPEPLSGDWSSASGYRIGHRIAESTGVSAVFCGNDHMALGLLRALAERGRRVPGDVSVVGFDDIPESAYFLPPLTTVRQDFGELGRRALATLVDMIDGRTPPMTCLRISPHLVVRASTARPSAARLSTGRLSTGRPGAERPDDDQHAWPDNDQQSAPSQEADTEGAR